jgi:hypothetical protein
MVPLPRNRPYRVGGTLKFHLLAWLIEPKSGRARFGLGFGCFAAAVIAGGLSLLLMVFASLPHCAICGASLSGQLLLAILFSLAFGSAAGLIAAFAQGPLSRRIGRTGTVALLGLGVLTAGYLCLKVALETFQTMT